MKPAHDVPACTDEHAVRLHGRLYKVNVPSAEKGMACLAMTLQCWTYACRPGEAIRAIWADFPILLSGVVMLALLRTFLKSPKSSVGECGLKFHADVSFLGLICNSFLGKVSRIRCSHPDVCPVNFQSDTSCRKLCLITAFSWTFAVCTVQSWQCRFASLLLDG